jgi:hypothetical protein
MVKITFILLLNLQLGRAFFRRDFPPVHSSGRDAVAGTPAGQTPTNGFSRWLLGFFTAWWKSSKDRVQRAQAK